MKVFLVTLELGQDFVKVLMVKADHTVHVLEKVTQFCKDEGYFPLTIRINYMSHQDYTVTVL